MKQSFQKVDGGWSDGGAEFAEVGGEFSGVGFFGFEVGDVGAVF